MYNVVLFPLTVVFFHKGESTIVLVYANGSKRIVYTHATTYVDMWRYKHINEVSSWLLGAGWEREKYDGKNNIRNLQSLFAPQLQKES